MRWTKPIVCMSNHYQLKAYSNNSSTDRYKFISVLDTSFISQNFWKTVPKIPCTVITNNTSKSKYSKMRSKVVCVCVCEDNKESWEAWCWLIPIYQVAGHWVCHHHQCHCIVSQLPQ